MKFPAGIRKDKNPTATALFGVAALLIFLGTINLFVYTAWLNWLMTLLSLSGIIYIALGFLAFRSPLPAAMFGFTLYAAFLVFESFLGVKSGANLEMEGLGFKIPIIILLLVAVVSPLKCSMPHKVVITTLAVTLILTLGFLVHALWLNSLWKAEVSVQAVYNGSEQARQDFQKGRFRLYELHDENEEDKFSGLHQGQYEIWYAEYHPAGYVQRTSEEKWVETYNQFMKLQNSWPSNSTPNKQKSKN